MEDLWLSLAKRLQSIASTGLHYCQGEFDKERYAEVASIANDMLASLGNVPVARIAELVPDFATGYATPKVEVRGAVIRDEHILLIREACDGLWAMPGGFADVGISPAENIVKEIREEASLTVSASAVYGIRHKAKHEYDPDVRDFYKIFFLCESLDAADPEPGLEATEARFFGLDDLPPLSTGRVLVKDIEAAFRFRDDPQNLLLFD
ncbi:MAG: NUDIX hydrolase [Gammaproteobacteria bacterium]|nr:NUDIX hydrolase [Gammaproteobacteria bacterium]NNF50300.1 NUDIX hydrolase [Woeseiaceae bacterium]MBT8095054.1 NUDIX hydrolase [Gammaproteobacteria bacterium]MBT8105577.1 NUDIX hydrolase [Gammaproteobacteria bacterium]NNK25591.1 NUDIX hydrolase [Woeseiaceae bacterium]